MAVFIVLAFPAMAQETSGGFTGGSIKIGYDNRSCNAALAGSVRYNSSTSCPEYCNGTTWICPNSSGGAPDCTDDSTATCTLDANRANGDPNFTAANISCDVNVLGVTGILGTSVIAPNAFTNAFTDLTSQPISTQITSNAVQITGVHCHSNITISGTSAQFRVCDDAACTGSPSYGTTGEIVNNQYLQLRLTTPSSYNTARTATPDINSASDVWSVTTCDGVPNTFTNAFTDLTDQALGATVASNIVQITGMDCSPTVTINSGASGSPRLRVCADATCSTGPAYVTSSSISNNQYLQLRITASGASSTTRTATPDIAGVNDNWTVTSCDGAPDAYSFTDVTDQPLGTVVNSDIVQVTGFTCSGVSVSVSGAATRKYRVCTDATCSTAPAFVTSGGTINSGEYLQLQVQTSGSYSTASTVTASIGGVTDSWSATTRCDNEPDPYKFADVYGQATSSTATSDIVQITGMGASCLASISISGTGGAQKYRVCTDATCSTGPAWVSSGGTITNNQYLQVEHTTSASNSTITTSVPDISGVTDTWRAVSTGVGCDTTPITYTAGGTQTFSVPANCNALVVETFGAGGGGGATGGGGGGGGSLVMRDSDSLVIGAAGGGGGGGASKGAGGGAYSKCAFITTGTGQNFTAYIGGGGSPGSGNNGGNGGAVSGGAGGTASGFSAPPGGGSTYGGGGGGSSNGFFGSGTGGNSTYGGAGGGGGTFPYGVDGGSSTYGGGGGGTYGNAQGGGTYLNVDCLNAVATNGSAPSGATGGAAANSGPGTGGNNGAAGGAGKVIITPAP